MKVYLSGGCKNGKSTYAEAIAAALASSTAPLYYIATMLPQDGEDHERIALHRQSRAHKGFETVEIGRNIGTLPARCNPNGTFLLDSTTALLANEMFLPDGLCPDAGSNVAAALLLLLPQVAHMVLVSDYIFSDAALYDQYTEQYRQGLAHIDRACAKACDVVLEVCCGNLAVHKGADRFGELIEKIM